MGALSEREKILLSMLAKSTSVKDAVHWINYSDDPVVQKYFPEKEYKDEDGEVYLARLSVNSAYLTLRRIRKRYLESRQFINTIITMRRHSPILMKRLTPKVPLEEDEDEEG